MNCDYSENVLSPGVNRVSVAEDAGAVIVAYCYNC